MCLTKRPGEKREPRRKPIKNPPARRQGCQEDPARGWRRRRGGRVAAKRQRQRAGVEDNTRGRKEAKDLESELAPVCDMQEGGLREGWDEEEGVEVEKRRGEERIEDTREGSGGTTARKAKGKVWGRRNTLEGFGRRPTHQDEELIWKRKPRCPTSRVDWEQRLTRGYSQSRELSDNQSKVYPSIHLPLEAIRIHEPSGRGTRVARMIEDEMR
ncbi:hypothetical protein R3P38DRAFT_2785318 [Favolaschia claudopus]|uniref:Uncharacterized protein n=1 Tax=Favolaschia claudopus TaxID=2862362 RepID=A0AAW0ATQ6_9AGAR